jgi:hypothetical protein
MKTIARINSTPQVPRAGMFIVLSVLEVTQRVPPTLHVASVTHVGIESGAGDGGAPTTSATHAKGTLARVCGATS